MKVYFVKPQITNVLKDLPNNSIFISIHLFVYCLIGVFKIL